MGRIDGKVIFIPQVIPGETVLVEITEIRKDFTRGRVAAIIDPSPSRREPVCPYFGRCGGCQLQHMSYSRQLEEKEAVLRETLARIGGINAPHIVTEGSEETGYRIRVQLHRGPGGRLGFKERRSERVVTIDRCPVCVEPINRVIASALRVSTDRLTLLAADKGVVSSRGSDLAARETTVTVSGRTLRCGPEGFFQSHLALLPAFVRHVTEGLSGSRVLDLYSGVGLFGSFLKDSFDQVISVDRDARSLALARENVPGPNHSFSSNSVENWAAKRSVRCEAVVVDPARPGLTGRVRSFLLSCGARDLVYVSCHPVTLARDLADLCGTSRGPEGYVMKDIRIFDFFPQTHHMEIVVRLTRQNGT